MSEPRLAIYFVPAPESALYGFGTALVGYDCRTGAALPPPDDLGIAPTEWAALTREPRRYGFHATMKAPFRLRAGCTQAEVEDVLRVLAAAAAPTPAFALAPRLLEGFAALVPEQPCAALDRLAAACVTAFDRFRAPLTAQERSRRQAAGLTPAQEENLERFGYPYVLGDFRWHMTLTGRLPGAWQKRVIETVHRRFAALPDARMVVVDRLALVRQDGADASFRVVCDRELRS